MTGLIPKVFVDFDGTISKIDVGNSFFRKFGNEKESLKAVAKWKAGEMSGSDLLLAEAAHVRVNEKEALAFCGSCEIDQSFGSFYSYCREKGIDITILSDGLVFYISEILQRNGLAAIPFYSNKVRFDSDTISIELPFESDCTNCANCKGNQILMRTGPEDVIVYIGNGYSDKCAVQFADMVFAKDDLLSYCEENNITYFPFSTFEDVLAKFRKSVDSANFRKRHRAELRRREAYLAE